jgi:hypothetical protein
MLAREPERSTGRHQLLAPSGKPANGYFTVNFVGLLPVPPGVVMEIVTALGANPAGTFAVTCESDFTVNMVAFTVPNFTPLV